MTAIKNFEAVAVAPELMQKIRTGADMHSRFSRITFEVLEVQDDTITVKVVQLESPQDNYATKKRLIDLTKELFGLAFAVVHVRAVPYQLSEVDSITPEKVAQLMKTFNIKSGEVADALGIGKAEVSSFMSGHRSVSRRTKAALYYFFKVIELENNR